VERSVYQQSGLGRVAIPMDLRLGIVEGMYTPRMARIATPALALMPEEEAAGLRDEVGTATLSNSTLGRLPRAIAARYELNRPVIAASARSRDVIPAEAVTVQGSLDGRRGHLGTRARRLAAAYADASVQRAVRGESAPARRREELPPVTAPVVVVATLLEGAERLEVRDAVLIPSGFHLESARNPRRRSPTRARGSRARRRSACGRPRSATRAITCSTGSVR